MEVEEERLGRIPERREREMGRGVQPIGIGCVVWVQASVVTG